MLGYLNDPLKTAEVIRDGWYLTGDIGHLDEDGYVHITDRLSRFSKIGGEMVPHGKVEEAIAEVIGDAACVVVGVPDDVRGERLAALYAHPVITPAELSRHLSASGLPNLWIPKRDNLYRVDAVPVLGSGKTDFRQAKAIVLNQLDGDRLVGQAV